MLPSSRFSLFVNPTLGPLHDRRNTPRTEQVTRDWVPLEYDQAPIWRAPAVAAARREFSACTLGFDMAADFAAHWTPAARAARSTITQQTVKNVLPLARPHPDPPSAGGEVLTPMVRGRSGTKRRIIEGLPGTSRNSMTASLGSRRAQHHFGVPASTLRPRKAARLCLPSCPARKPATSAQSADAQRPAGPPAIHGGAATIRAGWARRLLSRMKLSRPCKAWKGDPTARNAVARRDRLYHISAFAVLPQGRPDAWRKRSRGETDEERYWNKAKLSSAETRGQGCRSSRSTGHHVGSQRSAISSTRRTASPLMPIGRRFAAMKPRRLCAWFDDKFHHGSRSKLLLETV